MLSEEFFIMTGDENERLAFLEEECGEVLKAIGKIRRHGYHNRNPLIPNSRTNRLELAEEVGHLLFAVSFLCVNDDLPRALVIHSQHEKSTSIKPWLRFKHEIPEGSQLIVNRIQERPLVKS